MSHRRAALYLQIPAAYCRSFGGLRWAHYGEAVEFLDGPDVGRTFAFAAEIARFLEGLLTSSGSGSCLAFGCVLHLLYLIGLGERAQRPGWALRARRASDPFRELGSPLRNAGALCAWLCREVPGVADPPKLPAVLGLLNGGNWVPQMVLSHPMLGAMDYAEQPALEPLAFEERLACEIDLLSDQTIRHWLKHGRGPVETIEDRLVPFPPRGLSGSLFELEQRPRLTGLTRLIGRLEGALSLPPRRLDRSEQQIDGYSDLTTRGSPEQVLPIQFALEDEEFLRRFAERELLYFHREVPRRPAVEEVVLLLDQGVRTWGEARLVLASAAMALARQAQRRRAPITLATTGALGAPIDPAKLETAALAALLEASDFSPHPARMLATMAGGPPHAPRDLVLLTHPRNLGELEVKDAARQLAGDPGTRLFAVSVSSGGEVELAELRLGWPVVLGRGRVDLQATAGPSWPGPGDGRAVDQPAKALDRPLAPIPFPFRTGILDRVSAFRGAARRMVDFDEAGERILVAGCHGLLTTYRIDGDENEHEHEPEVLPRAIVDDEVMRPARVVIGVAGGFVLVSNHTGRPVLVHYDFSTRTSTVHPLARAEPPISWFYYPDLHAIAGLPVEPARPCVAIDLSARGDAGSSTSRAKRAAKRARAGTPPYPLPAVELSTSASESWFDPSCRVIKLDAKTGTLEYRQRSGAVRSLAPLSDGLPAWKGARIAWTRQGGDVLAMGLQWSSAASIAFISLARGAVLGTLSDLGDQAAGSSFALSRNGQRFAMRHNDQQVEVRDVPGDRPPVLVTAREDVWAHTASLGRSCLLVREFDPLGPRHAHSKCLVRWDRGVLEIDHRNAAQTFQELGGALAESRALSPLEHGRPHDPIRFLQVVEHGGLRALIDQYNHLAVLDRFGALIGVFYMSGREFAAWMPDGSCLGTRRLIGPGPAPGAAERFAAALCSAERVEEDCS